LLLALEEMMGMALTEDQLAGMDSEFLNDIKLTLMESKREERRLEREEKQAKKKAAAAKPAPAPPALPPMPSPPSTWLSPSRLFNLLKRLVTTPASSFEDPTDPSGKDGGLGSGAIAAGGGFEFLITAASSTIQSVRKMVEAEAKYNRYRPAVPAVPSTSSSSSSSIAASAGAGSSSSASSAAAPTAALPPSRPLDKYFVRATSEAAAKQQQVDNNTDNDGRIQVEGWDLPFGFGSFFHEYWLIEGPHSDSPGRETLLAVSVIDLLPTRCASVYFFYNTSFRHLQLGKLSALTEIWLTQALYDYLAANPQVMGLPVVVPGSASSSSPAVLPPALIRWWDANLLVHAVPTMSYKEKFRPSRVLCPRVKRGQWVDLTAEVLLALDENFAPPLGTQPSWDGKSEVTHERYSLSLPLSQAAAAKAAALKRGEQARKESEEKAGIVETQEALEAEEILQTTMHLLPPRNTDAILFKQLSEAGQDLLTTGLLRFMRSAGPGIATRILFDPSWAASLATREERQAKELAALKAKKEKQLQEEQALAAAVALASVAGAAAGDTVTAGAAGGAMPAESGAGMKEDE
jgi:Arginine-tRNA-protein transferase, C terminus